MKWFKHDTDASRDNKLQNVLLDYGLEGYGLYWYCLELIAGKVDKDNITFELEHDARIIARNVGSTVQKVEEMMKYFVQQGLFDNKDGVIYCFKLLKRIDKSMTSNPEMRTIIEKAKALNHDSIMIESEKVMQDQIRLDQNRKEKDPLSLYSDDCFAVLDYLNEVTGSNYRKTTQSHLININARLTEGHTVDDLKAVIDFKFKDWAGTEKAQYLRPSTLFSPSKFGGYFLVANKKTKSIQQKIINNANNGSNKTEIDYYLAIDGKKYTSKIAYHQGEDPIE